VERRRSTGVASLKQHHSCLVVNHGAGDPLTRYRAPQQACTLDASNDYDAVRAWLALHEAPTTQRAYRKEAERLMLWAIIERGRALSSFTTEDSIAALCHSIWSSHTLRQVDCYPCCRNSGRCCPGITSTTPTGAKFPRAVAGDRNIAFQWLTECPFRNSQATSRCRHNAQPMALLGRDGTSTRRNPSVVDCRVCRCC
jgi:hypothetical protein